ncbi:late embryogenesis abundant protein At1g64065-like [Herrania umbratica]|uniref:Late embryogenesis abundant protein At1g64065-like n=1 Tax=Herrania umbratica TaxID=108875 RepID=A0A6J1AR30_9ROSI|nr:late embryogenesis abundant protein At1g64065-like [Herrania umbratica]
MCITCKEGPKRKNPDYPLIQDNMQEDPQAKPLAPVEYYPRSDMEVGGIKPAASQREEKSSKCLVYVLLGMVIQGAVLLIFASIVLRARTPDVEIVSVTVRNLKYGNSSAPSFNLTLVTEITVENSNFGDFRFENTTGTVWCGSVVVGEMKIPTGRAQARATERLNVSVDVSSLRTPGTKNLSCNISSGLLELNSHVKLSGKVSIMDIMKRRRHPEMNCFMTLNLTEHTKQDFPCKLYEG